jgi:hypothetical protein
VICAQALRPCPAVPAEGRPESAAQYARGRGRGDRRVSSRLSTYGGGRQPPQEHPGRSGADRLRRQPTAQRALGTGTPRRGSAATERAPVGWSIPRCAALRAAHRAGPPRPVPPLPRERSLRTVAWRGAPRHAYMWWLRNEHSAWRLTPPRARGLVEMRARRLPHDTTRRQPSVRNSPNPPVELPVRNELLRTPWWGLRTTHTARFMQFPSFHRKCICRAA